MGVCSISGSMVAVQFALGTETATQWRDGVSPCVMRAPLQASVVLRACSQTRHLHRARMQAVISCQVLLISQNARARCESERPLNFRLNPLKSQPRAATVLAVAALLQSHCSIPSELVASPGSLAQLDVYTSRLYLARTLLKHTTAVPHLLVRVSQHVYECLPERSFISNSISMSSQICCKCSSCLHSATRP